jgi:AraC family L-rhamnose operon regulatory protein RhaS
MAWLEDHFAEDICWEEVAARFSLSCEPCTAS